MHSFKSIYSLICLYSLTTALPSASAQAVNSPPPSSPTSGEEEVINLDKVVVSAGLDAKTAFDLAQGASVLSDQELLLRAKSTLGETLSAIPGVNATYFGPGSSRPIIRGLGGDRVRMLSNGVGTMDLSNISPDHNVTVEPLLVERIEVLRGPATLLYGSSAVGGVVNVIDNSIPSSAPVSSVEGILEVRGDTAAKQRTGIVSVSTASGNVVFQVNGLLEKTGDVSIPGVAIQGPDTPPIQPHGTLPSSEIDTKTGSFGASWLGKWGYMGAAISLYQTDYGVPVGDDPAISISMEQKRLDLRGEITQPFAFFSGGGLRLGLSDYEHTELSGGSVVNTTFKSKGYEARIDLHQEPVGLLSGTIGMQTARKDVSSVGEEVVQPPNVSYTNAIFVLEELNFDWITWQAGARYEHQRIELGDVPLLPDFPGYSASSGEASTMQAFSGSTGVVVYPLKDYSVGLSLSYSQRLPTAQELFSNGPHGGTGSYEVGTSSLGHEDSLSVDLTLRKRAGFVTGSIGLYATTFDSFIFEAELPASAKPAFNNDDDLTVYQFVASNARFYGLEAELTLHLVETESYKLHLDLMGDGVRAEDTVSDTPLPRIPALRYGSALRYEGDRWTAALEVRHTTSQERISAYETPTGDYTLINASLTYAIPFHGVNYTLFLTGNNLGNAEARVHTSFLKDSAPLPGRNLTLGMRAAF